MRHDNEPMKKRVFPKTIFPDDTGKVLSNNPFLTYNCLVRGKHGDHISIDYRTISSFYNNACRQWIIFNTY
jgi:hypothetical protein